MASSATIANDGITLNLSLSTASGSWTSGFVISNDASKMPVVTVGAGGNANTLHLYTVTVNPSISGANITMSIAMGGYAYSGETCTITIPTGFVTDSSSVTNATSTAISVSNTSTKTRASEYTRMASMPVVNWATRDRYPFSGNTARIAFDAYDGWAGVQYVEVTFNQSITAVFDANVTNVGGNVYRITAKRNIDYFGYGYKGDYWYMDVDISAASEGNNAIATITKVHCADGVDHNPSTGIGGALATTTRQITVRKTPVIRYLDGTASPGGDGLSWATAWNTVSAANSAVGINVDKIKVAPGTYTESFPSFDQSRSDRYLIWEGDTSRTGDGSGVINFAFSGYTQFRNYQAIKNVTFTLTVASSYAMLRLADSINHAGLENCRVLFPDWGGGSLYSITGSPHIWMVGVYQYRGYRGPGWSNSGGTTFSTDGLVHAYELDSSGTFSTGQFFNCLTEHIYAHNNCTGGFANDVHSDFCHTVGVAISFTSGGNWTESTKQLTATGQWANLSLSMESELQDVYVTNYDSLTINDAGTGVIALSYNIAAKNSNDTITLRTSPWGADKSNSSIGVTLVSTGFHNWTLRYCRVLDNGLATGQNYDFCLYESPGRNHACYENICYGYQNVQSIWQGGANNYNMHMHHNTFLSYDNASYNPSDSRGITLTGSKVSSPYIGKGWRICNNLIHILSASVAYHPQGAATNFVRKVLYGPNVHTNQNADGVNGTILKDGSVKTASAGLAATHLTNITSAPYDFTPLTNSAAYHANTTAAATDVLYDLYGNINNGNLGAVFAAGGGPPPPDPGTTQETTARRQIRRFR